MVAMNPRIIPGLKDVDDIVAEIWEIDRVKLYIKTRKREVDEARMVAMAYRNIKMGYTLQKTADTYGLNHTSVIHAKKTVDNLSNTNPAFRAKYELFTERMKQIRL